MPIRRRGTRRPRPAMRRRRAGGLRGMRRGRRLFSVNPQPVFTETFTKAYIAPNAGGIFTFSIDEVPQLSQYNNLYTKYRILKAQVILLPNFAVQDQNQAEANGASTIPLAGMGRIVYAVNDTAGALPPTSEADLLKDNGCKIVPLSTKGIVRMSCRPTPVFTDSNGVQAAQTRKWLTFSNVASPFDPKHYGISWWYSQPLLGTGFATNNTLNVYVKLTFQLADPR